MMAAFLIGMVTGAVVACVIVSAIGTVFDLW